MKILIVNDDGIESKDIVKLTEAVRKLGDVWVVAPDRGFSLKDQLPCCPAKQ